MLSFHLVCLSLHVWRDSCSLLTNFQSLFAKCESHTESTRLSFTIPDVRAKANTGNFRYLIRTWRMSWCLKDLKWSIKCFVYVFVSSILSSIIMDRYTVDYIKYKIKWTSFYIAYFLSQPIHYLFFYQIILIDILYTFLHIFTMPFKIVVLTKSVFICGIYLYSCLF